MSGERKCTNNSINKQRYYYSIHFKLLTVCRHLKFAMTWLFCLAYLKVYVDAIAEIVAV